MKVYHNTREQAFRSPYGALELGKSVRLAVDVAEAEPVEVLLRTWIDERGEARYAMQPVPDAPGRYEIAFTPDAAGVVWYHFIVKTADGAEKRYGARDGMRGGEGELRDWEPPSFQLTVYSVENSTAPLGEASLVEDLIDYVTGALKAPIFVEAVEALRENVPPDTFEKTLSELADYDNVQLYARIAAIDANPAKGRLWCASLVQALMADGTCRASDDEELMGEARYDADCASIAENARDLGRVLKGRVRMGDLFAANDDVVGFWRRDLEGDASLARIQSCVLLNASIFDAHDVDVAFPEGTEAVSEVISGYAVPLSDEGAGEGDDVVARPHLYQLGSVILYFHPHERLQRPMEAGVGVLAHITSLPTGSRTSKGVRQKPGTLGAPALAFVDWLAERGMRYWQVLPVNPTDEHGSPYAGISAFAGNTRLLDASADLIPAPAPAADPAPAPAPAADPASAPAPAPAAASNDAPSSLRAFCEREAAWLEPYVSFMAIRRKLGVGKAWQEWPEQYRRFDPELIASDAELAAYADEERRAQYAFECQWLELRAAANERGIKIIGDMPIYVSPDSSDVWAHPEIFQLDADGRPLEVAGCPPDAFTVEGQIWGNPVYDWEALRESGYDWWLRRLERAFELYDIVRLDHFIGFARYYTIPNGEKATKGAYRPGPAAELFERAHDAFGPLPIIAEDLGLITPAVRALVAVCGFPGMDIVQFVDGNDPLSGYAPRPEKVAYSGTHDNRTLVGYASARYPHLDAREAAAALVDKVLESDAPVRIIALQDLLGLDDDNRMNTPGTTEGNWIWQARPCDLWSAPILPLP